MGKLHFLITAGGTKEYIDPVRFISNASSGRMGFALADAVIRAGHKATLITTVRKSEIRGQKSKVRIIEAVSAGDMFKAVKKYFDDCDFLVMAAAVSDYTPIKISKKKIKKQKKSLKIILKPTTDIIKWAGKYKKNTQKVIGFALEDKNLLKNAEKKMAEKNLDAIIANTPAAIGADKSTIYMKFKDNPKWLKFPNSSKAANAKKIISRLCPNHP